MTWRAACAIALLAAAPQVQAAPTVAAPQPTPAQVTVGVATELLVTSRVDSGAGGPAVLPGGVNLLRTTAGGVTQSILGVMHDDGSGGDSVAGDGVFSLRIGVSEAAVGAIYLRTSAAFRGLLRRVLSPLTTVAVVAPVSLTVPQLIGSELAEAQALLAQAGLSLGTVDEAPSVGFPSATVIAQAPDSGSSAQPGDAVDLTLAAVPPAPAAESLPAEWEGLWTIATTYLEADDSAAASAVETSGAICTGDPVGLALLEAAAPRQPGLSPISCRGGSDAGHVEAHCDASIEVAGCTLALHVDFALVLEADRLLGTGAWSANDPCGLDLPSHGQRFAVSGTRTAADTGDACAAPLSSVLQKFFHSPLSARLGVAP